MRKRLVAALVFLAAVCGAATAASVPASADSSVSQVRPADWAWK